MKMGLTCTRDTGDKLATVRQTDEAPSRHALRVSRRYAEASRAQTFKGEYPRKGTRTPTFVTLALVTRADAAPQ